MQNHQKQQTLWIGIGALVLLPFLMLAIGLTLDTATLVVIFAIAATGLNLLVGYAGLTSFGHGTWFGIGGYAAALAQKHLFEGQIVAPFLFSVIFTAAVATVVGALILRRRGVYFALLTLAIAALTYAIAFRWTAFTGGEGGLGGVERFELGPLNLDDQRVFYLVVAALGALVLYVLLRFVHSPLGHVIIALRENSQRAAFQGYDVQKAKLVVFVMSASVTGLAGALLVFDQRLAAPESTAVVFSGELLAMVVIGGMRSFLGPALGALFYLLFRELLSIWTSDWLLWFGLAFVGFIMFSPTGLVGLWERIRRRPPQITRPGEIQNGHESEQNRPMPAFLQPPPRSGAALEVRVLEKRFGGIHAVANVSLSVQSGEVHALIGPNGAGKTTTFNLISGLFPADAGSILLHGREIHQLPPHRIARRGLARSFQITNLYKGLSVHENLRLSRQARHGGSFNAWRDVVDGYPQVNAETEQLIRYLGLEGMQHTLAGELSYGGQRLVDMGIALGSSPRTLLLDEPLAGLAVAERERVSTLIQSVAANIPVLIVEHDIDRVFSFSSKVTVMNQGEVLTTGTSEEVRTDRRVQEIYTGTGTLVAAERKHRKAGERGMALRFEGVDAYYGKSHILDGASLDVREGEIVALVGRNGAGKSTLLKTITGLVKPAKGTIDYAGRSISGLAAPEIARLGIGYVPQGRGLFAGMTVAENLALGRLARAAGSNNRGKAWTEREVLEHFPRLRERMNLAADYLSGGEQQMLAVGRALSGNVSLLLLDEPFEGLAPTIVQELFAVFDQLREHLSILIVEHNLDLVLALADRVFALERGRMFHSGPAEPLLRDLDYRNRILWL